eukprot:3475434-Karenia_brevis.AAC.1
MNTRAKNNVACVAAARLGHPSLKNSTGALMAPLPLWRQRDEDTRPFKLDCAAAPEAAARWGHP